MYINIFCMDDYPIAFFSSSCFRVMSLSEFIGTAREKGVYVFTYIFHSLLFIAVYKKKLIFMQSVGLKG